MIKKNLNQSLVFSVKRNQKNELVLLLPYTEMPEIEKDNGEINRVGLNHFDCLEIHLITDKDIIEYTMPYKQEIVHLIKRYNLQHVVLGLTKDISLSLTSKVDIFFEGFLKLYEIDMSNN